MGWTVWYPRTPGVPHTPASLLALTRDQIEDVMMTDEHARRIITTVCP